MKKFTFIGISIAIALGFAACQKEDTAPAEGVLVTEIFSASLDAPATKTVTEDGGTTVTWAANDKVYYYSQDNGTVRNCTIDAAGVSATLTLEREESDNYYHLVYAGGVEPNITTNTINAMVISNGVTTAQNGTFASANVSVAHTQPGEYNVTFKPVTALVKFTTERTDIKTVYLTAGNNAAVAGDISVDPVEDSPIANLSGDGSASITVTFDSPAAGTYYINVLPATYSKGFTLFIKDNNDEVIGTVVASKSIDLSAGGKMINLGNIDSHIILGALPGVFSISSWQKVRFSKGNLRAKKVDDSWTWGFYEHQYRYNSNPVTSYTRTATSSDTEIDLFCWGYDESGSVNPTENATRSSFTDWGSQIGSGWKTLTGGGSGEWYYLLTTRTNADKLSKNVKVCGVTNCLVIAPDNFSGSIAKEYTAETWPAAEASGLVCLPRAGYRNGAEVKNVGYYGYYWTATPVNNDETNAFYLQVNTSGFQDPTYYAYRYNGRSVRLVYPVE